ncbi:MAG: 4-hydroxy-tetrahydrodipicolinate synthase [Paludibacteraceae bacterium]|nr:4-hydroxy-tetrahydrodipicolinate synthase [Paludibacteraceae bacterium]
MQALKGLGTALITPFDAQGQVDYAALERVLDKQLRGGVDYLVVLGTTGEAVTLTDEEQAQVRQFIVNQVNGRIPLVLGVGGNCTAKVVQTINRLSDELRNHFTAILSVCPFYNKPSQEGLFQHFTTIAQASPVPVILYNVPGRTGINLLPETAIRIWQAMPDKIAGIKEASGNLEQIKHLLALTGCLPTANRRRTDSEPTVDRQSTDSRSIGEATLMVISGDDGIAAEVMQAGGAGLISVASNAWPEEFGQIVRSTDPQQQLELQARFANKVRLLFKEGNPSGIKTVLSQMGLINNVLRLPLVPNSTEVQEEIKKELLN